MEKKLDLKEETMWVVLGLYKGKTWGLFETCATLKSARAWKRMGEKGDRSWTKLKIIEETKITITKRVEVK